MRHHLGPSSAENQRSPDREYLYAPQASPAPSPSVYQNDGYSTDHSAKYAVPTFEPYQPATFRQQPAGERTRDEPHAYMNTSHLMKKPMTEPPRPSSSDDVDLAEEKRKQLYSQQRPSRPPPSAAPAYTPVSQPPGYYTSTRQLQPSARPTQPPPAQPPPAQPRDPYPTKHSTHDLKRDSFSTLDTKSIDSLDSEFSNKPPPNYRPYDHLRQYSDEHKPFETDIDSTHSYDHTDRAPLYQSRSSPPAQSRLPGASYQPSPLVRDYMPARYDTESLTSSQRAYDRQNMYNSERELDQLPPAETDVDAMSEMTDDWQPRGPPQETDF